MRGFGSLILALAMPPMGCDVAVGVAVGIRSSRDRDSRAASPVAVPPETSYRVWVAELPDSSSAAAQQSLMAGNGGDPDPASWTQVGTGTATAVFEPSGITGTPNAVLIQTTVLQNYNLDAIEVLDASDTVVVAAAGTVYSGQVASPTQLRGAPDGVTADLAASGTSKAFIFTVYSAPLAKFRVNAWPGTRSSGDVQWVARWAGSSSATNPNATPGGFDVAPSGSVYVTVSDWTGPSGRDIKLVQFSPGGAFVGETAVSVGVASAIGSHGVAIDASGSFFLAMTATPSPPLGSETEIRVAGLNPDLTTRWSRSFGAASLANLVQWNSIALDGNGNPVAAGGVSSPITGIDHWMTKLDPVSGATIWTQGAPVDAADTYWYAVGSDPANQVYSAGDLTSSTLGKIQAFIRKAAPDSSALWSEQAGTSQPSSDRAQAVAVDASGNVIVGGFIGTASQGRNAALFRFTSQGILSSTSTHDGRDSLDDEILGVAGDVDGTVYAVGYETLSGQTENLWVRKYAPSGIVAWTRTYDGGAGRDRGIAVRVAGPSLIVAGYEAVSGTASQLHVRSYVK